jgi:hypothetical protein
MARFDRRNRNGLTVGQLSEILKSFDKNMPVHIAYDYGDYCHRTAAPIATEADQAEVFYSEYMRMNQVYESDNEATYRGTEEKRTVFVIR